MRRWTPALLLLLPALVVAPPALARKAPTISLAQVSASPGETVGLSGSGFHPHRTLRVRVDGDASGTVTSNRSGTFTGSVDVPADAVGEVVVEVAQRSPVRSATTALSVVPAADSEWGMDRVTADGAGANAAEQTFTATAAAAPTLSWSRTVDLHLFSPPVVADGVVFSGGAGARFDEGSMTAYTIDAGELLWRAALPGSVTTSPAVADGVVVAGDTVGYLTALSATSGARLWSVRLDEYGVNAPITIHEGTVYVGAGDVLHALDLQTGMTRWSADPQGGSIYVAPAVVEGVVYAVATQGVSALDAGDGSVRWSRGIAGLGVYGSPAVTEGRVYLEAAARPGGTGGAVTALAAATGDPLWSLPQSAAGVASPAVHEGTVYAAMSSGEVVAVDAATGGEKWRRQLPGRVYYSSPVIAGDVLYIGADDSQVHALDLDDGSGIGTIPSGGGDSAKPVIADGHLLVASECGELRAYAAP